jgi:hypothetical protein
MTSRDAPPKLGPIIGYIAWFIGALGQAIFMGPMVRPHLPALVVFVIFVVPWLLIYGGTMTSRSFISPRLFGFCLGLAVGWFATVTVVAEILYHHAFMPKDASPFVVKLSRVLMHVGWLGLLYVIPSSRAVRADTSEPPPPESAPPPAEDMESRDHG